MGAVLEAPLRGEDVTSIVEELVDDVERGKRAKADVVQLFLDAGVMMSPERVLDAFPRLRNPLDRSMSPRECANALLGGRARLERGTFVPVAAGAGYGVAGGAYIRNTPPGAEGKVWRVDPALFYQLTERNEQLVISGRAWDVASPVDIPLPKVGILHELCLIFTGTMTVTPGTGSFTQGWKWPWGIFGRIALQAGGEASLQYGTGVDFRTRHERLYRIPPTGSVAGAGAGSSGGLPMGVLQSGANAIKVILKIPVAHDLRTGMGSIYRASDDLFLNLHIDQPAMNELVALTGNATAVWTLGSLTLVETYMTPEYDDHGLIVLPEVRWLFMTTTADQFFSNNGPVRTPIPRLAGKLLSIEQVLDQGSTVIAPASLSQVRFRYGANQQPITLLPDRILEINRRNYNGLLNGGNYYALDGEVDNPQRDPWVPTGFTEGAIEVDIPSSITPAANSRSHLFFESLVRAA